MVVDAERRRGVALRVEVDDQDVQPLQGQGRGEVDRGGRLADATLLVGHRQDAGPGGPWERLAHPAGKHAYGSLRRPSDRRVLRFT